MYSGRGGLIFSGQGKGGCIMKKIIEDFRKGIEQIRWFASLFAERLKIEVAIFKLLYESDRMTKVREEMLRKIGERIMELKGHEEKNILRDSVIAEAVNEIEKLEKNIRDLKSKAGEIGRVAE
jgi:uncharacterized protein YaaW (UPF0174 family)